MYGYIYLIKDHWNNKLYIGQKVGDPNKTTYYYGTGKIIQKVIKKRKHLLSKRILGVCNTKNELDKAEKICIEFFNVRNPIYGYNISIGGQDGFFTGCTHLAQSKRKISLAVSGSNNGMYHKRHPQYIIDQIKQKNTKSFDSIKTQIENTGYKFITTKKQYKNMVTHIDLICPNGHKYHVLPYAFLKGNRCKCETPRKTRMPYAHIQNECIQRNYQLLMSESEYYQIKKQSKMNVICDHGHKVTLNIQNFMGGHGCTICGRMKKNENDRRTHKFDDKLKKQIIELYNNEYKINDIIHELKLPMSYNTLNRRLIEWGIK